MEKIPSSIQPYLDEIAQCLWSRNASIMIGAGFSMNAKATFDNAKRFPNWQDLGNAFYKKVRGEEIRDAKYNFFDPLKLAYEVESNFGRSVLDSMLRANIPDSDYKPSDLHSSLLSLPWSDVFTTNYDTLLERAAESVNERNYKVVVNKDNLIHSTPPRIVKLHGCFSASTPLIISEEDYRTYPQKFAPFVNTVQQTLLENTLCLIGFSGDDPNFLKWIGWIRDNLGAQNAPKIYLIGALDLSKSQEKSLAQYNITCVDMSLCEGVSEHDHHCAIKTFINFCVYRKVDESHKGWKLSHKLRSFQIKSTPHLASDDVNKELSNLVKLWEEERLSYPNWLVAPNELRRELWENTRNWSKFFYENLSIKAPLLKGFIYEFLWRKEKSLLPIFDNEVDKIWDSIKSSFTDDNYPDSKTLYISLALLRYYREEGKKEDWGKLFNTVSEYFNGHDSNDYLTYEKALHLLIENESIELTKLLSRWSIGSSSIIWMYRKASILAETNRLTDAQDTLEKALIKTRQKINSAKSIVDYANLSLESYILVLLTNVNHSLSMKERNYSQESRHEYLERLDDLKQFQCNPWQEIQLLELEIKHKPADLRTTSIKNGFDIGRQQITHHFNLNDIEAQSAFKLLRFFEDASLPFSLPRLNIGVDGANNAIMRVATYAPYWSMSTMIRTRNKKSSELIFTRESLYNFDTKFIDGLAKRYVKLLNAFVNDENSLYEYGSMLPEALSRLCCRISLGVKDEVLNLIVKIYSSNPIGSKFQSLDKLVERLILSYKDEEIIQRIKEITDISYYEIANIKNQFSHPNPFEYFINLSNIDRKSTEIKISSVKIKFFLNSLTSKNNNIRKNSSLTLIRLKSMGFLNKNQTKSLLSKLLSEKSKHGLPENTDYFNFAFIEIFDNDTITESFKKYIIDTQPVIHANTTNPKSFKLSKRSDEFSNELVGSSKFIKWNNKELHIHAKKLINWWNSDKISFEKNKSDREIIREMKIRFSLFIECIDIIIIKNNLFDYKEIISEIINDFKELGIENLSLKASTINYLQFNKEDYIKELEDALSTFEEEKVIDSLWAINRLLCESNEVELRYLDILATFIRYSRGQYLKVAFQIVTNTLNKQKIAISPQLERSVLNSLDLVITGFEQLGFEEKLTLKKAAAKLAYELSLYYSVKNINVPLVISTWKDLCGSDNEFAEIRNQWKSDN